MSENKMTKEQMLNYYKSNSPKELIHLFEGLKNKLWDLGDICENCNFMFKPEVSAIVNDYVTECYQNAIESVDYGDEKMLVESYESENDVSGTYMPLSQVHENNIHQLLENSAAEVRTANANQFNLNQLTPFDAFLPFTIIRSYLPLVGKDLIPTQTPAQPFIRIKQQYKYIVTKDNKKYLRPDVYSDPVATADILATAKGPEVSQKWYPAGKAGTAGEGNYDYEEDGQYLKAPDEGLKIQSLDLLGESGGVRTVGDDLDIDVCVSGIRAVVKNSTSTEQVVEQTGYNAYPDITAITPQRSVSFKVRIPVKSDAGELEKYVEDMVYGDYDAATDTFNLVSLYGYVRQVQFGGHLSNKNNHEYLSFTHEFGVTQHPIPEGYRSNVPITYEDMQLYNQTASIDIVATAINEMTEIFTQLEDTSIIGKIDDEYKKWNGKGYGEHPFEHMFGPVVFNKTVSVKNDSTRLLKRNQYVQDEIQYAVARFIGDMRDTLQAEPFRVVAFAHPNICSLFVGDNIDWKITPGATGTEGIRTDYKMGVYTANGDSFRVINSMKIKEEDGIRFLIYPVNEQNFLSWKHFKYSMYFDRDHRNPQMDLVPNVMGLSRFYTHSYTPLQAKLIIKDYK